MGGEKRGGRKKVIKLKRNNQAKKKRENQVTLLQMIAEVKSKKIKKSEERNGKRKIIRNQN